MSLFKKSFPPKENAFYVKCKTSEQRTQIIQMLLNNGFKGHSGEQEFSHDTHPNIQVHQSDMHAERRGKYFNVWSLVANGINTGTNLKVYSAKAFL